MAKFPKKLSKKLENRIKENAFRKLTQKTGLVDFSSNDYLGFSKEEFISKRASKIWADFGNGQNGATGSRLLSGNHQLHEALEAFLANFYHAKSSLIFNSGYDANLGFFSTVPQRGDSIMYDELCHASIRDGIRLSNAHSYKFKHNDLDDLDRLVQRFRKDNLNGDIYVATESVFSMDGDSPDVLKLADFCSKGRLFLVIDEAHAVGVFEKGMVSKLGLEEKVFARIITFGKAFGIHGAAILGSTELRDFLVNYCRSFIYTTALAPHALAMILASHEFFEEGGKEQIRLLREVIDHFKSKVVENGMVDYFCLNDSAIQVCQVTGNDKVKGLSMNLEDAGFDVRPILSPTVAKGEERLRFCLHSYNSTTEMDLALGIIKNTLVNEE